jgi:hypothetical protein
MSDKAAPKAPAPRTVGGTNAAPVATSRDGKAAPPAAPAAAAPPPAKSTGADKREGDGGDRCYAGRWVSKSYPSYIAGGSAAARLNLSTFTALLYFRYEGLYHKGQTTRQKIKLERDVHPQTGKPCFALRFQVDAQEVSFRVLDLSAERAEGTYKSAAPSDAGTFLLHAVPAGQFDAFATSNPGAPCALM